MTKDHLVKLDEERILLLGWGIDPCAVNARQLFVMMEMTMIEIMMEIAMRITISVTVHEGGGLI